MSLKGWIRGLSFCFLWFFSILMGHYFLCCPLLPLMIIKRRWYRKTMDIIMTVWETYPVALMEVLYGCKIIMSGDFIRPNDNAVVMMNHRNRLDWYFFWAALLHGTYPPAHCCKFVLKSGIRKIPGVGWAMQMACFLYINRKWLEDQELLSKVLNYLADMNNACQVLIFPEGTNMSPSQKIRSDEYAKKNNLQKYNYVLHPRTTGLVYLIQKMRYNQQLDAVYDITVGYPYTIPETEIDMMCGKFPEEVHFNIKRYPSYSVPEDTSTLKEWCCEKWEEKEKSLTEFYKKKRFSQANTPTAVWNVLYLSLVTWTIFVLWSFYVLYNSFLVQIWVAFCTVLFLMISQFTGGIQHFEIALHRREKYKHKGV